MNKLLVVCDRVMEPPHDKEPIYSQPYYEVIEKGEPIPNCKGCGNPMKVP